MSYSATGLNIEKGNKKLLNDANFTLSPGSIISLIGKNGAGKSTLLAALAGNDAVQSGSISLHSTDITQLSTKQLALQRSYMAQQLELQFPYSAKEVVQMAQFAHAQHSVNVIEEVMRATETWEHRNRRMASLSGGEQQRVYLAHCLAQLWHSDGDNGPWLLLDEPFSAQDLRYHHIIGSVLRELATSRSWGIILVNHIVPLSQQLSDQFLILENQTATLQHTLSDADIARIYDIPQSAL